MDFYTNLTFKGRARPVKVFLAFSLITCRIWLLFFMLCVRMLVRKILRTPLVPRPLGYGVDDAVEIHCVNLLNVIV